jgi:hypothetical protein
MPLTGAYCQWIAWAMQIIAAASSFSLPNLPWKLLHRMDRADERQSCHRRLRLVALSPADALAAGGDGRADGGGAAAGYTARG